MKKSGIAGKKYEVKDEDIDKYLRESYLSAIIENQPGLIWLKDINGKVLTVNSEFVKACNISSIEEAIGKTDFELWEKEIAEKFSTDDKRVIETRQSLTVEEYIIVNGEKKWYETFKKAIIDENGNVKGTTGYARDITQRKQADEALRKSEARFKAVSHSASDAIITANSNGSIVDWNKSAEFIFGYSEEEIIGNPLTVLMEEKYHSIHSGGFQPSAESNVIGRTVELSGVKKSGKLFPMELSLSKWETTEGSFYTGIIRDVTERHTAQAELENSRQFLERIINTLSEPVFVKDKNHKFVLLNDKFCKFMGYEKEELIGKGDSDFFPKEQIDVFIAKDNEVFESEQDNINEEYFTNAEGKTLTIVTKKSVFKRKSGEKFIVGIINDVTDIKANQIALEESEQLLRESQKIAGLGNFETDFKTLIWKSSEVLDEIFGIDAGFEHTVENWVSIMHPDYRDEMNDYFFSVIQNHIKFDKEYKFIRQSDGEVRWAHGLGIIQYDADNNPVKLVGTVQDITERKKMDEALIAAKEKAEASDKLKTAFLNNISHEIRTPLNGILGFGELVTQQGITHENKQKFLGHLQKSTKRLMNTVTDYMDISLVVSGGFQVNPEEVNISKLIRKVSDDFSDTAKGKGLQFNQKVDKSCAGLAVYSDPELIEKVLYQVLNNAFKFTHNGQITVSLNKTNERILIEVSDTGIGMSPESQKYIFDFFRQESEGIGRFYEGNGLGLSIAKGIVELLGGEISVTSEKGEGSAFLISIPYTEAVIKKSEKESKYTSKRPNLLIVEDDESNMYLLEMYFRDIANVKLYKATNGQEAFKMCRQNPEINIILMDMKMPVIDGYKATVMIKAHNPDVKIIALTAYAMSGDGRRAIEAGCDDYIPKPVVLDKLIDKMQSMGFDV
ncbi:MAG: PAS domain S-box protein [Ignavibacteriota bacterium]